MSRLTERIVRMLAGSEPEAADLDGTYCVLCSEVIIPFGFTPDGKALRQVTKLEQHATDCPWRLARDWCDNEDKPPNH